MGAIRKESLDPPGPVEVYTDGGCKPNPGPGGWGAVVRLRGREWFLSGNNPQTTNNQMEIQAAAASLGMLESLFGRCPVDLYTDSEYLRQGITEWIEEWERRGWRTKKGEPVRNQALWQTLHRLAQTHDVSWHWLRGHAGNPHNERADQLATRARQALTLTRLPDPAARVASTLPKVEIYVKVSYRQDEKKGSWAVILRKAEHDRVLCGRATEASANALLIRGAAEGLRALTRPCSVMIYSDAGYLIQGASQWIKGWLARDWQTRDGKPVANRAEWEALLAAMRPHQVSWRLAPAEEQPHLARAGELATAASSEG